MHGEVERHCKNCNEIYTARSSKSMYCRTECMLAWNLAHLPTGNRVCKCCKIEKPLDKFRLQKTTNTYTLKCTRCMYDLPPKEKAARAESIRNGQYRRMYGISTDEYERLYKEQRGKCKICGTSDSKNYGLRLSVDHCHSEGDVRGLLCGICNRSLGGFKDDPKLLIAALRYLNDEKAIRDFVEQECCLWAEDLL